MQELFGIPMGPLAAVLSIALAIVVALVSALALRNRVFFKLGVRNVGRRRGRTALIVTGLMLGTTIIAAAPRLLSSGLRGGGPNKRPMISALPMIPQAGRARGSMRLGWCFWQLR